MRIGFLLPTGIERPAGARYFALARALTRSGYSVVILALHPNFAACTNRSFVQDGVQVRYVGQMHVLKDGGRVRRFSPLQLLLVLIRSTLALTVAALILRVDAYHLGKPQPINGVAGIIASRLRRRPLFVDCDDYEALSNRLGKAWQQRVFAWWEDRLPALAVGVTANTTFLAQRAQAHGARRVVLVPNGVDPQQFVPLPPAQRLALRRALRIPDQIAVVGYIGTLSLNNHPVDLLLRSFGELRRSTDAVLLIVGGGEDLDLLRAQAQQLGIADDVRFVGHVPRSAVATWTSLCAVTVDPVHDDPVARARCPLKLVESLALGIPTVTGDVGDRRALLADGAAGVLVQPGSARALADGVRSVLADPALRQRLAQGATTHAAAYRWHVLAQQWRRVYEQA